MPRLAFFAASRAGRPPHEPPLPSSPSAKLLSAGLRWRFGYDAEHRLVEVRRRNADGSPGPVFGKFTYDALGRRASAVYDDSGDADLGDETVEYFAYDPAWRLSCIYRQGPEDEFGIRPAPVAYERFLYADGGLAGSDASFSPGFALDCPTHSQIDANADGTFERTRRYILNQFGDVAGVIEDHAPGAWSYELAEVVRYSPTGLPRVIGHFGADIDESGGSPDEADVAAFFALYGAGDPRADFNGSGGTPDEADVELFFQVWDAGIGQGTPDDNRFGWRGYLWDARLGLYHVRHRVYDPRHAAWLTPDPAGYIDGLNLYAYCRGDLVNKYDPYGLWGLDDGEPAPQALPAEELMYIIVGDTVTEIRVTHSRSWKSSLVNLITFGLVDYGRDVSTRTSTRTVYWDQMMRNGQQAGVFIREHQIGKKTYAQTHEQDAMVGASRTMVTEALELIKEELHGAVITSSIGIIGYTSKGVKIYRIDAIKPMTRIDPAKIRFSQRTAGGGGRSAEYRALMKEGKWIGEPLNVVELPDGTLVSLDNTRLAIARELGINEVPVNIHKPGDKLPSEMKELHNANTWGELLDKRTKDNNLPKQDTCDMPKLTGG